MNNLIKNKNFTVLAGIGLLVLILAVYFLFLSEKEDPEMYKPTLEMVTKLDGFVLDTDYIVGRFKTPIPQAKYGNFSIKIEPEMPLKVEWLSSTEIKIFAENGFWTNQGYTLNVLYKGTNVNQIGFTVYEHPEAKIQEVIDTQRRDDEEFAAAEKKLVDEMKWYPYLPIVKENYVVVYDFERKQFRISIKNSSLTQAQVNQEVQKALADLKQIEAPTNNYYIKR